MEEVAKGIEAPEEHNFILGFEVQSKSVVFNSGYCRPATIQEVILWQEYQRARADHQSACTSLWDMYCAGTGKTIESFNGINSENPVEDVRNHRLELERNAR